MAIAQRKEKYNYDKLQKRLRRNVGRAIVAATGVRVGWAVGPVDVINRMSATLGHVGAWAPRAEQMATVAMLDDPAAIADFHATFKAGVLDRLRLLYRGLRALREA